MRYQDSIARSAEYLRTALPMMSRQRAALHPVSYAVWYEFVSGSNPALAQALQELTQGNRPLDETQTWELYRSHIAELDTESATRLGEGLGNVLGQIAHSAELAEDQTQTFGRSLGRWNEQLRSAAPGQHTQVLAELMAGTQDMQSTMKALRARLHASQSEIEHLRHEVERTRGEVLLDALTGLANRRAFEQRLNECAQSEHAGSPVAPCLLLSDIDGFRQLNERYGLDFGDQVLRSVARVLQRCAQSHHVVARVGGEEFALLMPEAGLHEALMLAEQLREGIASTGIASDTQGPARVTLSLGVTQLGQGEAPSAFLARADLALQASKRGGRNRVTVLSAQESLSA